MKLPASKLPQAVAELSEREAKVRAGIKRRRSSYKRLLHDEQQCALLNAQAQALREDMEFIDVAAVAMSIYSRRRTKTHT